MHIIDLADSDLIYTQSILGSGGYDFDNKSGRGMGGVSSVAEEIMCTWCAKRSVIAIVQCSFLAVVMAASCMKSSS